MALGARELTHLHRRQQLALRTATVAQVKALWPTLDWIDLDKTFPAFAGETLRVVSKNRKTSSGLAAAYLRAFRVSRGLSGDLRIVIPQMPAEQFATSLRVTSVVAVKKAATAGTAADVAMTNALTQTTGAMARLVLNAGRATVLDSIKVDPAATGWERVLGGVGCEFCRLLAGRVYPTDNAGFDAHDHCGCTAEPVYA